MISDDDQPLLSHQEQIERQDQGLDDLAAIIRRQREIGITIGNEVDQQNGIINIYAHYLILRFWIILRLLVILNLKFHLWAFFLFILKFSVTSFVFE